MARPPRDVMSISSGDEDDCRRLISDGGGNLPAAVQEDTRGRFQELLENLVTCRSPTTMRIGQAVLLGAALALVALLSSRSPSQAAELRAHHRHQVETAGVLIADAAGHHRIASSARGAHCKGNASCANASHVHKPQGHCADYGCGHFNATQLCQCNPDCHRFGSCCADLQTVCEPEADPARRVSVGDEVLVQDTAISRWLHGTVTSLEPFAVRPDGWRWSYGWGLVRQGEQVWRPKRSAVDAAARGRAAGGASGTDCKEVSQGERCYGEVMWTKAAVKAHPDRYPGIHAGVSFADAQAWLHHHQPEAECPAPCRREEQPAKPSCLCLFDVDRTLTGKQGAHAECPGTEVVNGTFDGAFGGGTLVLSELARGMNRTFCASCYRGIVSAGQAGGHASRERAALLAALGGVEWTLSDEWSEWDRPQSLLAVGAHDAHKQETVRGMVRWLRDRKGVQIEDRRVHFFDDNDLNAPPFFGTGFNARQVSCANRSHSGAPLVGFCGGMVSEVVEDRGVFSCRGEVTAAPELHL